MQLADLGAEVIKIENPNDGGDVSRSVGPYFLGDERQPFLPGVQPQQEKRDAEPEARRRRRRVLHELVRTADAVLNNLRGDHRRKLGSTYAS